MDKHALSSVVVLLLLVATQAHIQSLRETTSSSSSGASSSIVDVTPSRATFSAGDPPLNRRGSGSEFSSYSHEDNLIEAVRIALLPRDVELPSSLSDPDSESVTGSAGCSSSSLPELISSSNDASSAIASQTEFIDDSHGAINIQGSNAVSSDETGMDVEALESSNSTSKRIIVTTTAPVIYVFSSSSLSVAAVSNSDDAGQSTTTPTSLDVVDHDGNYQYSAGTVTPNEERSDIESTALELSTSPDQVDDDEGKTPFTSTRSTASSGKKATSTSDQATSSDHDNNGGDNFHVATNNSAQSSPILYACMVLGVAGVVGAVFAFRAKRKRNVSEEWRVTAEASAMTPRMLRRASWAPPASQVHVIIDDHNFALL